MNDAEWDSLLEEAVRVQRAVELTTRRPRVNDLESAVLFLKNEIDSLRREVENLKVHIR